MELHLNGIPIEKTSHQGQTLEQTLRDAQALACRPGHLIISVRCDGQDVPANQMEEFLSRSASSYGKVEAFTSTREQLVLSTMSNASASLQETEHACRRIAEKLNEGHTAEAVASFGECLRVWQQIHDAVGKSIQLLNLDPQQMTINDEPLLTVIRRPMDVLVQVKQAIQSGDYVLLADLLQFEFGEVTDKWFSMIACIRQEAEDAARARREPT